MGDSCLVYHELVMTETAGKKGPSVMPTKKRQSMNAHGLFIAGIQIVTQDQPSMHAGRSTRGLPFAINTFAGIWEMM